MYTSFSNSKRISFCPNFQLLEVLYVVIFFCIITLHRTKGKKSYNLGEKLTR